MGKQSQYEGKSIHEIQAMRNNSFALITHWIEVCIICVAYFAEFAKGARPLGYIILTCVIGLASPVAERLIYKKNPASDKIKHLVGFGFALFTFLFV